MLICIPLALKASPDFPFVYRPNVIAINDKWVSPHLKLGIIHYAEHKTGAVVFSQKSVFLQDNPPSMSGPMTSTTRCGPRQWTTLIGLIRLTR
jgi:hypothetical protein